MLRILPLSILAGLLLGFSSCRKELPEDTVQLRKNDSQVAQTSVNNNLHQQNRLNTFFYLAVIPKLEPCWRQLRGKGEIDFTYAYRSEGPNWIFQAVQPEKSTLAAGQEEIARRCMENAVRQTSFPMEAQEANYRLHRYTIHWGWPVPFPPNVTDLGRAIDTGGLNARGGCVECELAHGDWLCSRGSHWMGVLHPYHPDLY